MTQTHAPLSPLFLLLLLLPYHGLVLHPHEWSIGKRSMRRHTHLCLRERGKERVQWYKDDGTNAFALMGIM